jgi:dTDP-4-dehydrorhamnose reductase
MRVLLIGADGMLGRAMQAAAPAGVALRPSTVADLDITDAAGVDAAMAGDLDWVINCAAWTRVDDAEEHEAEATRINGEAVGIIARAAARHGARVLHISTDYVFDGQLGRPYREDDVPNPQGAYGRSKLAGEKELMRVDGGRWMVVRTQWLYGGGPSFVRTMWSRAKAGQASRVVADQFGAPTHVSELAQVIWRLAGERAEGIWHAAAGGYTNWFEVARLVYAAVGADPTLVTSCTTAEFGARAPRPADGRLDTSKLGGMRPYDAVLTDALHPVRCSVQGP